MVLKTHLLLLDLDGVVVVESRPPLCETLEIAVPHDTDAEKILAKLDIPVVVLTHRSRAQARGIVAATGLQKSIAGIIAAEDILIASIRHGMVGKLLKHGLRKSFSLPEIERRFGLERSRMAFIDNHGGNIDDMARAGLGLVMLAPFEIAPDNSSIITFDFAAASEILSSWTRAQFMDTVVRLPPITVAGDVIRHTGHTVPARSLFDRVRGIRHLLLQGLGKNW